MLEVSKCEANVEQTPEALLMMRSLFAGVPAVLHAIVIVLLLRFNLNQREHAAIREAIDERNGSDSMTSRVL